MRRTNVMLPEELLEEIDRVAGKRKRSRFIAEAIEEKLARVRFEEALAQAAGAWSDENHPELKTQEDINRYLERVRRSTDERIRSRSR
ncbi:MAG: CopG family ribbon-helix-helix protein [Candidatus Bipolaricaulia bacterium]